MGFRDENRGVASVIGFLLIFAILIIAFSMHQAYGVPNQNLQTEFDHNQDVQADLQAYSSSIQPPQKRHDPVRIRLGTRYTPRLMAVNPPPPIGSLHTTNIGDIEIHNASIQGTYQGNASEVILNQTHSTKSLVYTPNYAEYHNAPVTIFEHSLLYNDFEDATLQLHNQRTIDGERQELYLVQYDGDVAASEHVTTITPETLDGPTGEIHLTPDGGDPIVLQLPTQSPDIWIDELADEPNVEIIGSTDQYILIELDGDWTLQLARIGFDGGSPDDVFSSIQPITKDPEDIKPVFGPSVTLEEDSLTVTEGTQIEITDIGGDISTVGSTTLLRSGTPIESLIYDVVGPDDTQHSDGTVAQFDVDDSSRLLGFDDIESPNSIDTSNWETGNHTLTIYGTDASGRDTDEIERESVTIEIVETVEPELGIRIDDLTHVRDDNTQFLTSVAVEDDPNFQQIEITYESLQNPWADETDTITSPRGSSFYQVGGTAGDQYEITIEVIHNIDGSDEVVDTQTITTEADANNPIEEDLSEPNSPVLDHATVVDRSNAWDGVRYRIDYGIDNTADYQETQFYVIGTEDGGYATTIQTATSGTVDLETDGYEEEFKIAVLAIDSDGVVVDAYIDYDTAEETMAGNTDVVSVSTQEPDLPGQNPDSEITFTLEKDGPSEVTIDGIAFVDTISDATTIDAADPPGPDGGASFIRTDTDETLREDPISLDTGEQAVGENTFQQWETPSYVLGQFRDENDDQVDMAGESATIRLYFSDGSSREYELQD